MLSIVKKPRQIRIDLDPEQGFPTKIILESTRIAMEGTENVGALPVLVEEFSPASDEAVAIFGTATAQAMLALLQYQQEVQRLARLLEEKESASYGDVSGS